MAYGGGGGAGKANFTDLSFMHSTRQGVAGPDARRAPSGEHIKEATLTSRKAGKGQQEYLIVKMNDVLITSVQPSGSTEQPMESVSMQFSKVELEYKPQKEDGSLDAGRPLQVRHQGQQGTAEPTRPASRRGAGLLTHCSHRQVSRRGGTERGDCECGSPAVGGSGDMFLSVKGAKSGRDQGGVAGQRPRQRDRRRELVVGHAGASHARRRHGHREGHHPRAQDRQASRQRLDAADVGACGPTS